MLINQTFHHRFITFELIVRISFCATGILLLICARMEANSNMLVKRLSRLSLIALFALAACNGVNDQSAAVNETPTLTLAPIVSMTPRFTATPVSSRTPLPTFTLTPSETPLSPTPSDTPTPSATPPITGIVASLETVNVREGPGVTFSAIKALVPGTGVEILGQNEDGRWLNIKMDDGQEGWIASSLVRVNPMPTLIPTSTPSPDLTALALGTPLPTAILGGGTITPTPPRSVVSPTPIGTESATGQELASGTLQLPVIDVNAIQLTATALNANGITVPQPTTTFTPLALPNENTPTVGAPVTTGATLPPVTLQAGEGSEGSSSPQQGVDVLAYCDNPVFGKPAPSGLKAGATIDIFWSWYTSEEDQIQQHLDNVIYEVRIDDVLLDNWRLYKTRVRKQNDGNYYVYWFVPYGPLAAGPHKITYLVTWKAQITDGYDMYGPGTNRSSESGSCTFTVS
jgi:hypothetical protein